MASAICREMRLEALASHPLTPAASGPREVPPGKLSEASQTNHLERAIEQAPEWPLLVTQASRPRRSGGNGAAEGGVRVVSTSDPRPIEVESDLFRGRTLISVRKDEGEAKYEGAGSLGKRRSTFTLEGRFKKSVAFEDLVIGHEFNEGVVGPPRWQRRLILGFLHKFFPHLKVKLGERASALAPVILECKRIKVRRAASDSEVPALERGGLERCDVREETSLLGGFFAEKDRSPRERRRFFSKKENLATFSFDPDLEYTFEFYQNNLSFIDYKLRFGIFSVGIGKIIKGQPVQFLIKNNRTKEYLCYFQFWSAKLLGFFGDGNARTT